MRWDLSSNMLLIYRQKSCVLSLRRSFWRVFNTLCLKHRWYFVGDPYLTQTISHDETISGGELVDRIKIAFGVSARTPLESLFGISQISSTLFVEEIVFSAPQLTSRYNDDCFIEIRRTVCCALVPLRIPFTFISCRFPI